MKRKLPIGSLKTISQILSEYNFLQYGTRKRNLAYQLQYLEFKLSFLYKYKVYGSIEKIMCREIVISITNIIEYLLFVSLREIYKHDPKNHKLPSLIGQARRKDLIKQEIAKELNEIVKLRNKLHPSKQKKELDINCFTIRNVNSCMHALSTLRDELRNAFNKRRAKIILKDEVCHYEGYSQVLFDDFLCPYCGEVHY